MLAISPFGNGWDYFVGGSMAALTGPPAYFVFKAIYGGSRKSTADDAAPVPPDAGGTARGAIGEAAG